MPTSRHQTPKIDRQREHQANERTFLAWLRTSVSLIAFGLAIARFGLFLHEFQSTVADQSSPTRHFLTSQSIGMGLIIVGIVTIALSVWRYNQVFQQIELGDYQPDRLIVWIIAGIVIILGTLSIPLILWRQPLKSNIPSSSGVAYLSIEPSSETHNPVFGIKE